MELYQKILKLRKAMNHTQLEFADKIGISRSTLADIERGGIPISKRVKSKLSNFLDIESGYFEGDKTAKNTHLNQVSESGLNQLLEIVIMKNEAAQKEEQNKISKATSSVKMVDFDKIYGDQALAPKAHNEDSGINHNVYEKQLLISEMAVKNLSNQSTEYTQFRKAMISIQGFQNILDNLSHSAEINKLIRLDHITRYHLGHKYVDLIEALNSKFELFRPHISHFIELSDSLKSFAEAASHIPESILGIDPDEFKDFTEINT